MSRLFLGVDGGQSSTTAMIGDETGRVVGFGRGSECNHVKGPEGRAKFINRLRIELKVKDIDVSELFKEDAFSFHHGFSRERSDIT